MSKFRRSGKKDSFLVTEDEPTTTSHSIKPTSSSSRKSSKDNTFKANHNKPEAKSFQKKPSFKNSSKSSSHSKFSHTPKSSFKGRNKKDYEDDEEEQKEQPMEFDDEGEDQDDDDGSDSDQPDELSSSSSSSSKSKKKNRDAPQELSSKIHVKIAPVVKETKVRSRDPRFDEMAGSLDESKFKAAYGFVEELKKQEIEQLMKEYKKTKNPDRKAELQATVSRLKQQQKTEQKKDKVKQLKAEWKKKEKEQQKQGKQPFFLKKSEEKKLELASQYLELKQSGKLSQYMAKRRKKNAAKDHRWMPYEKSQ